MGPYELLRHAAHALETLGIRYFITGSVASVYFGEPRFTNDIDIVVELSPLQARRLCQFFPAPEFYVSEEAAITAASQGGQFNVIHPESGLKVDLIVGDDNAFNRSRFERVVRVRAVAEHEVWLSSAEDVILKKMDFYREGGSEKHLRDIAGVLKVSGSRLDRSYIEAWAKRLGLEAIWRRCVADTRFE